jgi:hypothetical protein
MSDSWPPELGDHKFLAVLSFLVGLGVELRTLQLLDKDEITHFCCISRPGFGCLYGAPST